MSHRNPTIAELGQCVHKGRHREIGNWLARRIARPTAVYGTWVAVRLGLSAHQVTLAALLASLAGAAAIGSGSRLGFILGVAALHLGFWLDHVDGQVARFRRTVSLDGVYLDYLMHHVVNLAVGFALGFGLARRLGEPGWAIAGFAITVGWAVLALHNDCRYKAFFQRLKSASGSYRVEGGSGGRPAPPSSWPRKGFGALSWPALKACEPHVVLLALTGLAVVAPAHPVLWQGCWLAGVAVMAVMAPALGAAALPALSSGAPARPSSPGGFRRVTIRLATISSARRSLATVPWTGGHSTSGHQQSSIFDDARCGPRAAWSDRSIDGELDDAGAGTGRPRPLARLPERRDLGIGVVGAGFIVRDCHLVAYAAAGFPVVGITSRIASACGARLPGCGGFPMSIRRLTRCSRTPRSRWSISRCLLRSSRE